MNDDYMKTIMEKLDEHIRQTQQMLEPEHGQQKIFVHPSMLTTLESALYDGGVAKSHTHNWQLAGVQVVVSEHAPPNRITIINDDALRAALPTLTIDPKSELNEHAPTWEPNFTSLLQAASQQLIGTNRGHYNTIICVDGSPIIPERPRRCWTCGQTFMSRRAASADRQCLACVNLFIAKRHELHCDLERIFYQTLYRELRRLNKPCPANLPDPPFKSVSQQRQEARAAKARARRKALRLRKRSGVTQQTA